MTLLVRLRQKRLLREAEGYLELIQLGADIWQPDPALRDRLARRALAALGALEPAVRGKSLALHLRGHALRLMERYEEALEPLRASADQEPRNLSTWFDLGWCYKRVGRLDRAIEALQEALELAPREALVHYNLACYYSLAGHTDAALAALGRALEIDRRYLLLIDREHDFDPIRQHPSFRELTGVVV